MVLKKSKFGGNTGNTLRRSGKGTSTYRTTAFISKKCQDQPDLYEREEWMGSGIEDTTNTNSLNTFDNTKFSLNKDNRWLLPAQLKREIREQLWNRRLQEEDPTSKKACDRDESTQSNVAVVNKMVVWGEGNKENKINSFTNSMDRKYNQSSSSSRGQLDIPSDVKQNMDVTYTVEKAVDSKSWPYHAGRANELNHKMGKKYTRKYENFDDDFYEDCWDDDEDVDADDVANDVDDDLYDDAEESEDETYSVMGRKTITLEMFMKPGAKTKTKKCRSNVTVNPEVLFGKGNYIVIEKPEENFEITDALDVADESFEITSASDIYEEDFEITNSFDLPEETFEITNRFYYQAEEAFEETDVVEKELDEEKEVEVERLAPLSPSNAAFKEFEYKVKSEDISSECLLKLFGKRYVEARCTPRRFIIFNDKFNPNGIIMSVTVVSEGSKLCTVNITLMNISNDFMLCLDGIDDNGALNLQLFADLCFPTDDAIKISKTSKSSYFQKSIIEKEFKPKADFTTLNDVCQELFTQSRSDNGDALFANCYQAVCPICYSIEKLTFMKDCPHYACDACWKSYISKKMSSGEYNTILCPDTQCEETFDIATIICFLDHNLVSSYIRKLCELHIQRSSGLKLCPSEDCDAVAVCQVSNLETSEDNSSMVKLGDHGIANNPIVDCHCRLSWCFNCQLPDHWPSSCLANKAYQQQKKEGYGFLFDKNGNTNEIKINYRPCPKCNYPITKDGGNKDITCSSCKHRFCWNCLSDLIGHGGFCGSHAQDQTVTFNSLDVFNDGPKEVRMQRKAFEFKSTRRKIITLKQKLKLNKMYGKMPHADFESNANTLISTASRAVTLLDSGYKLLENLSVANALCESRTTRARIIKFVKSFTFVLGLLYTSADVNGLDEINIANVQKNIEFVESSLKDLSFIGGSKK